MAATGGDVVLEGARSDLLPNALETLESTGAKVTETDSGLRIVRQGDGIDPVTVETQPFPGSPPTCRLSSWH